MRRGNIDKQKTSARREKRVDIAQRDTHVADGVHDIRAENDVESARLKLLLGSRFFEIKSFELYLGKCGELLSGRRKERSGDIAKRVGMQPALQHWKHLR